MAYARTALLLAALTAIFLAGGFLIGGEAGMMIALVVAVATNAFAYWNSDRLVLRMHGARPIGPSDAPGLHRMVSELAGRAGIPVPALYLIETPQPNAFATGRNPENAAVAVTRGLLERLDDQEVIGVIAHELAHVRNHDTLIMTITATLAGAIGMLANFAFFFGRGRDNPLGAVGALLTMLLAPVAAMLVQFAISRSREFAADRTGAEICGEPLWLASALERLEASAKRIDNHVAEANPASAHLFIVNPLHARRVGNLFSTHPSTAERVARLCALGGATGATAARGRTTGGPWGGRPGRPWG